MSRQLGVGDKLEVTRTIMLVLGTGNMKPPKPAEALGGPALCVVGALARDMAIGQRAIGMCSRSSD